MTLLDGCDLTEKCYEVTCCARLHPSLTRAVAGLAENPLPLMVRKVRTGANRTNSHGASGCEKCELPM